MGGTSRENGVSNRSVLSDEPTRENNDSPDFAPNKCHVKNYEIGFIFFSIMMCIVDVGSDVYLACIYYADQNYTYALLTILLVLVPTMIIIVISVRWYCWDENGDLRKRRSIWCWCVRIIVMILQLAPILRYITSLSHAIRSLRAEKRKDTVSQRKFYKLMLKEDADAALLRVLECFLESAPQLVLQFTIIMIQTSMHMPDFSDPSWSRIKQIFTIAMSLVGIAWSVASYQRSIRFAQENKKNITKKAVAVQIIWHLFIALSRILSFAAMASVTTLYTSLLATLHWLAMTVWLMFWRRPKSCDDQHCLWQSAFCAVLGLVYIFAYISTREGPTRKFYIMYYLVYFIENVGMLFVFGCFYSGMDVKPWYFTLVMVLVVCSFLLGIVFMLVYYTWFHPMAQPPESPQQPADDSLTPMTNNGAMHNSQDLTEIDLSRHSQQDILESIDVTTHV